MISILIYKSSGSCVLRQTVENAVRTWCKQKSHLETYAQIYKMSCEASWCFMFFVVYVYVKKKKNPLADNQPKNILNYEELTNTGPFNWLFLLLGSWKGHAVTMVSVWIQKKAITCSLVWWGICFNIIIVALTKTWAWRVRSSVSKHLTMKKKKNIFNYIYYL